MAPTRVLFICQHNSGRSQMAEAFLRRFGMERFEAASAGPAPTAVDPLVAEVMLEDDFDLSTKAATDILALLDAEKPFHYVITTCGPDGLKNLPPLPAKTNRLNWAFPDPALVTGSREEQLAAARSIRDDIRTQVIRFVHDLS